MKWSMDQPFSILSGIFQQQNFSVYLVGGSVRNRLLGFPGGDLDITSAAQPKQVEQFCKEQGITVIPRAPELGTVELHLSVEGQKFVLEHTTLRRDFYPSDGSHRPGRVEFTEEIAEDALRRDFTVNALYVNMTTGEVEDPLNRGMKDLADRRLCACRQPAELTLREDGLRVLRMVRFACELGFDIQPELYRAAKANVHLLKDIAKERIRQELDKILMADVKYGIKGAHRRGLMMLKDLGAIPYTFPLLEEGKGVKQNPKYHRYDVETHNLASCAAACPDRYVRLAALLHDLGKPRAAAAQGNMHGHEDIGAQMAVEQLRQLKYDNRTIEIVSQLVKHHMFDLTGEAKTNTIKKKAAQLGKEQFTRLIALRRADFAGSSGAARADMAAVWQRVLDEMVRNQTPFSVNELKIDGKDLMKLGIPEGRLLGQIKERLWQLCVLKPGQNKKELLLKHAADLKRELQRDEDGHAS